MNGIKYRNPEEMKDSRIEWLGAIPLDWNRGKIFYCFRNIGSGSTPNTSIIEYYENGNIPWLLTGNLNDGEIETITNYITEKAIKDNRTLKIYPKNTLVMAMYGATIGKLGILNVKSTVNQACCCLSDPRGIHNKFVFYYLLYRRNYIISLASGGGQPNINREIITKLKIPISSMKEQIAITNFLDYKTSQFDSIIQKKEQLIQKLEEAKKSLISEVVTGKVKIVDGVLVEKDPSEMKDSGVDWLGKIPRDWIVTKIKFFFDIQLGKMLQPEKKLPSDVEKAYLCTINVDWSGLKTETLKTMWFQKNEIEKFLAIPNDIIINEGGDAGKACILNSNNGSYHIQNAVHRIRERGKVPNKYLYYWLFFLKSIQYVDLICNKATIMHLTSEKLKNLEIPYEISSIFNAETKIISNFLDYKTTQFESMIEKQKSFIEKLKQAKQSLISEAVTGKIDLRDWQIIQQEAVS